MRLQLLGVVVAVALGVPRTITTQEPPTPSLSAESIATAIGSEADARAVLSIVLTQVFRPGRQRSKDFLLRSQIRPEWLPVIEPPVDLPLLTDAEADALLRGCGTYWTVSRIERSNKLVSVRLTNKCDGSSWEYAVSLNGKQWELTPGMLLETLGPGSRVTAPGSGVTQSTSCSCLP